MDVSRATRTSRRRLSAAALLLVVAGAVLAGWVLTDGPSAHARPTPAHVSIERDGFRYEYDAVAGTESLTDMSVPAAARVNLAGSRQDETKRLRGLLETQLDVDSLDRLHAEHLRDLEDVRRLGYY